MVMYDLCVRVRSWVSPIKRQLSREKSIPTVRGVSSSPSVVGMGVNPVRKSSTF